MAKSSKRADRYTEEDPVAAGDPVEETQAAVPEAEESATPVIEDAILPQAEPAVPVEEEKERRVIEVDEKAFCRIAYGIVTQAGRMQLQGMAGVMAFGRMIKPNATYEECLSIWEDIKKHR